MLTVMSRGKGALLPTDFLLKNWDESQVFAHNCLGSVSAEAARQLQSWGRMWPE